MVRMNHPSPFQVGREFVRQYYSLLNKAPEILHRFYGVNSSYVHGIGYCHGESDEEVIGQTAIHKKIMSLHFKECHTKVYQVDAHSTLNDAVVVQVIGELSNNRKPLRRFMQTFVLAPQGDNPYKFYVHNDIFRYEDEVYRDDMPAERQNEEEHISDHEVDDDPEPTQMPSHCENHMNAQNQIQQIGNKIEQHMDNQAANSDSQPSPSPPSPIVNDAQVFEPIQDPTPMEPEGPEESAFTLANDSQEPKIDSDPIDTKDDLSEKDESSQVTSWAALASKNTPAQHNFQQGTVVKMNQAHEVGNVDQAQKPAQRPPRSHPSQPPPPRDDSGDAGGDMGVRRGTRYPDNQQIFVGNLPYEITENDLREHFAEFGEIIDVRINHSHTSNPSFGFVIFEDPKSVEEVLRQMPTTFKNNKRINIEEKKQRGLNRDGRRGPGGWDARRDNNRGGRMQNRGPPRKEWGGPKEGQRPNNYGPRR